MPHSIASISEKSFIGPREQRAFGIARTAQKKWCRGKIDDPLDPKLAFHSLKPEIQTLAASLFFSASCFSSPLRSFQQLLPAFRDNSGELHR